MTLRTTLNRGIIVAMEQKRLYRSRTNKVFAGICGGVGEYFNVDPVAIRLAWVVVVMVTGFFPGALAYIIAIYIIPEKPISA